jgi:TRAP-type mannitol/chloroaromatic compound transport system substrate-binding protein
MLAKYDALNPGALRELVAGGAQLRAYPEDVMAAGLEAANAIYAEIAGQNEMFRKLHDSYMAFRNEANLWNQVAEFTFDSFMIRNRG